MGSKEKILNLIDYVFEREQNKKYFIDLFAGGFSVSGFALATTKFNVISNDLNHYVMDLYREILSGANNFEAKKHEWIGRAYFNDIRDNPESYPSWFVGYVLNVWSFGCNQKDYLYAKDLEENKHALHQAIIYNDFSLIKSNPLFEGFYERFIDGHYVSEVKYSSENGKRVLFMERFKMFIDTVKSIGTKEELLRLEQMENISQMEHIDAIKKYVRHQERLKIFNYDWKRLVEKLPHDILKNAVIYCDPPYENTKQYRVGSNFNYLDFWNWFRTSPYTIYVSSYNAPADIKPLNFEKKLQLLDNGHRGENKPKKSVNENLYWNGKGVASTTLFDMLFTK
jgi:site-specific DNA-adenine methylase